MIDARIDALWGDGAARDFAAPAVFHVTAIGSADGAPVVLRINADTPRSETDRFALSVARARADAIVATGKILRDEPSERFAIQDPAIAQWRRDTFAAERATLAILTSGRAVDFAHPAFTAEHLAPVVFTSNPDLVGPPHVEVVHWPVPTLRAVIEHLSERGHERISIEAGPSAARALYDPPLALDELLLSEVEGPLPTSVVGGAFFGAAELRSCFAQRSAPVTRTEHDRTWRFVRYVNARRGRSQPPRSPAGG